ncbi:hypothetical protein G7Y89_g13980 [Cudoniella acicularis]|uniref:RRM domain-containing protein n=1 Tax=Cudoniella acicularis TaxID=354080 RepID=A0A8H4VVX4_9HELO|nr:hypothetical protein G7Y89_g13980 [Cudoniella acicularis]
MDRVSGPQNFAPSANYHISQKKRWYQVVSLPMKGMPLLATQNLLEPGSLLRANYLRSLPKTSRFAKIFPTAKNVDNTIEHDEYSRRSVNIKQQVALEIPSTVLDSRRSSLSDSGSELSSSTALISDSSRGTSFEDTASNTTQPANAQQNGLATFTDVEFENVFNKVMARHNRTSAIHQAGSSTANTALPPVLSAVPSTAPSVAPSAGPNTAGTSAIPAPSPAFKPTNMVLAKRGLATTHLQHNLTTAGISYQGDLSSLSYRGQVDNLPDSQNCSLFIINLPLWVTYADLFAIIHVGSVYALNINAPDDKNPLQAAKLIFMSPAAAQRFISSAPQLGDRPLRIRYNRHGQPANSRPYTRVLVIDGPEDMMKMAFWTQYFSTYCDYQLENAFQLPASKIGIKSMEFRFARVDGQAQCCKQAIERDAGLQGVVKVSYGRDPCAGGYK